MPLTLPAPSPESASTLSSASPRICVHSQLGLPCPRSVRCTAAEGSPEQPSDPSLVPHGLQDTWGLAGPPVHPELAGPRTS